MAKPGVIHFIRFYWLRIFAIIGIFLFSVLFIAGIVAFCALESFYKQNTLASLPLSLLTAFIFASVYTFMHYWFFFGGGMTKFAASRIKSKHVNVK